MKNIERITKYITKHGAKSIIIHSIPEKSIWITAQKIEKDQWALTMCNPMGNVTYNLGIISDKNHLALWKEITQMKIEKGATEQIQAEKLRNNIQHFLKRNQRYKNFIKLNKKITINKN